MTRGAFYRLFVTCLALLGLPGFLAWGQSAEALARKGNVLYKQGSVQEATDAYRQALMRKPENSLIKYNLGTALAKGGHAEEAQQKLREAAEAPGTARGRDAYYNMGVALGEGAQKVSDAAAAPGPGTPAPGGGAAPAPAGGNTPGGAAAAPAGPNPLEQKVQLLEQSLGAFRKTILATNPKDEEELEKSRYNYETVQEMLRQAREQLKEQQQQQQQNKDDKNSQNKGDKNQQNKDEKNPQSQKDPSQQDSQNKDQQQKQDQQKDGQQNGTKPQPTPQATPQAKPQQDPPKGNSGTKQGNPQDGQPEQLKPEQVDALGLLNMLENEKPDQFKQLFRFRGDTQKHLDRDW